MTRREAILCGLTSTLPDDSTARLLQREFARPDLSYVLLNFKSRRRIATRWVDPARPVPAGSLVKPFTAFAHGRPFPDFTCRGESDGCSKAGGHGRLSLPLAIAFSCNAYFLNLAVNVRPQALAELGLPAPRVDTPKAWAGLGDDWPIAPLTLVQAYCELWGRSSSEILQGMRLSARSGTAHEMRCDAYAKTGTAPCNHAKKSAGDGYAVALYPSVDPRFALLVSLDGAPGATAAKVCGAMLRRIA